MLTERTATVLNVLVGEYLQTATPVASDKVARSLDQKLSSASVRNTMARLTEGGYISRPHLSSGGVPYDLGYRFYVESLPQHPRVFTKMRESVDRDLAQTEPDIGAENQEEFLNPFGVILCNYGIPQGVSGTICVTGPKRMEYVAAIGGVRHLSAFMSQMVLGIQRNVAE